VKKFLFAGALGITATVLNACSLFGPVVRPPTFEMREAGFERFDPPGIDAPARAIIRLTLDGRNPNPVGGRVEELNFDLLIDGQKVAGATSPGLELAANNVPKPITIDVDIPINPATVSSLLKVARGDAISYRLEGAFRIALGSLGSPKFGPYTLAQGTYKTPSLASTPPSFKWRSDLTRLGIGLTGATLDLGFEVSNPGPIGYKIIMPLGLNVGGQVIASAEAGGTIKARDTSVIYSRFTLDPIAAARVIIGGKFDFGVSSAPKLEVPGLDPYAFPISLLFNGSAAR
jgi:Late embryogenesis abundant protein